MPFDLSEDQLIATEKELAATFPKSYRSKMKRANGGSVEAADDVWELIPIRDVSDRKRHSRTTNHVLLETASFSEWGSWPGNACALAQNGAGDALVIFRCGPTFEPEIFVWRHEDGSLELVADDFSTLRDA